METKKINEVIGEALMPYALDYPYADLIYITVLVPEDEYITQTGNESACMLPSMQRRARTSR